MTTVRRMPSSSFSSPLHSTGHSDPAVKAAVQAFMDQYGNKDDEHVQVLSPDPVWKLEDIVGTAASSAIEATGQLQLHCAGDTGFDSFPISETTGKVRWSKANTEFETAQAALVGAMISDLDATHIDRGPAFLLHLGDVNYFDNTRSGYAKQFYEPFAQYSRKIIAITGNHDVEVGLSQQHFACEAFIENFCNGPWIPPAATGIAPPREMVKQPGLYWRLDAPFIQIIGLCTNVGENGGVLRSATAGTDQYDWFCKTLKEVAADQKAAGHSRRGLAIALHHPPYTTGNHVGSPQMSGDLDQAFKGAGIWPDIVLAAHDHNYQRFTRTVNAFNQSGDTYDIPYVVCGGGGRYHSQFPSGSRSSAPIPGVTQELFGKGNGYGILTAKPYRLTFEYKPIDHLADNPAEIFSVDLRSRRIS